MICSLAFKIGLKYGTPGVSGLSMLLLSRKNIQIFFLVFFVTFQIIRYLKADF